MPNEWVDDPTILDPHLLLRRVHPKFWVPDKKVAGGYRAASGAFEDDSDGHPMSVFLQEVLTSPRDCLVGHLGYRLVRFTAGFARGLHQRIAKDPDNGGPAHAVIVGLKTHAIRRQFAYGSEQVEA